MKNTITKYLFIFLALVFILVVTISYLLYLKKSAPQTLTPPSAVSLPLEARIGTVTDVSVQTDGQVKITVDETDYLLPSDLLVKLYTSDTETTPVPIDQLKPGTIVNVLKFTNPDRYEVIGVTDKALSGKLI